MKSIKELMGLDEADKMKGEDPCWDTHQMVGMKMKNGRKVPNCVPKAKPKNEEVETVEEASDTKRPPNFTMHPIDRQDYKILRPPKKTPPKDSKEWGRDGGEKKIKEETESVAEGSLEEVDTRTLVNYVPKAGRTLASLPPEERKRRSGMMTRAYQKLIPRSDFSDEIKKYHDEKNKKQGVAEETEQIDELNKDTLYSYSKKADADIENKHKSLGQLMRKGDATGANKAAHQINRRLAGMDRAEKRLNTEEVEQIDEISAEVKQKYLASATKKHLQQFLGRAPVRDKQELDKRRAAIQKTSKELTGKTHYQEEVEVEESKKIPASDKPVDPKDLVVSLKDVPVKKPRGHTQYDPSKEFPGVKALKREETELEEAQFWGNKEMAKQANAASGSTTTMRGRDAKGVYTATLVRKKGESEHKEVSRVYDTKEEVEDVAEAQSAKSGIYQTDVFGAKAYHAKCMEPNCKWESKRFDKIKQAQAAAEKHAKGHFKQGVAEKVESHAAAADYNSKRGWTNEELELEEEKNIKKVKMTPQERAYKRKLGMKAILGTVQEAVKKMRENKKGDPSQSKNVKKGEPLSGKQEPIKVNPELQEK